MKHSESSHEVCSKLLQECYCAPPRETESSASIPSALGTQYGKNADIFFHELQK